MNRTRIITLLVVLALALTVVAPALAYEPQARIPWRELSQLLSALTGLHFWGFYFCAPDGETYAVYGIPSDVFPPGGDWREWPDWLLDEWKDYWNDTSGTTFGPCGHGSGVQNGDIYP